MYITEAMISSMEDMQKNASEMEKHIKGMMEIEARSHGLELDSRHNARDMWAQLSEHIRICNKHHLHTLDILYHSVTCVHIYHTSCPLIFYFRKSTITIVYHFIASWRWCWFNITW